MQGSGYVLGIVGLGLSGILGLSAAQNSQPEQSLPNVKVERISRYHSGSELFSSGGYQVKLNGLPQKVYFSQGSWDERIHPEDTIDVVVKRNILGDGYQGIDARKR